MIKPEELFKLPTDQKDKSSLPKSSKEEFEKFRKLTEEKLSKN